MDHDPILDQLEEIVPDQLEDLILEPEESTALTQLQKPPPDWPRTLFRPLFFIALGLAAALATACGMLYLQQQSTTALAKELEQRTTRLSQEAAAQRALAEQSRAELEQREEELAQAQQTIEFLEQHSFVAPDGAAPEYTRLYPDLYAPEWEGEAVTGERVCCLTFDDGPSANTERVLAILDQYHIKGTFFVVGRLDQADQERMKQIVAAGHTIAMHSWSHDYERLYASVEAFLDEFNDLYTWIHDVTGVYPSVYRFPGGSINSYDRGVYQEIIAEMTRRGFVYFDWNVSAQDATASPRLAVDIAADCLRGVGRDLVVLLCHDSAARDTTVDALPAVIEGYSAADYTFSALHPGVPPVTFGYPAVK